MGRFFAEIRNIFSIYGVSNRLQKYSISGITIESYRSNRTKKCVTLPPWNYVLLEDTEVYNSFLSSWTLLIANWSIYLLLFRYHEENFEHDTSSSKQVGKGLPSTNSLGNDLVEDFDFEEVRNTFPEVFKRCKLLFGNHSNNLLRRLER